MINETKLLNYIYQNAEMGIIGIANIKDAIKNKKFMQEIKEQENDYLTICEEAKALLCEYHESVEPVAKMATLMTMIDAKRQTIIDNSTSNLAKMMMTGNNKGIIEIEEKINNYDGPNKKVISLAKKLLRIEKKNLNNLKKYL